MSETNINLTPEVVNTIYDLQQREYALLHIDTLQQVLTCIIRGDMGSDEERLKLAGNVLSCKTPCATSYYKRKEV